MMGALTNMTLCTGIALTQNHTSSTLNDVIRCFLLTKITNRMIN
jgi:hypothetical protein